MRNHQVLKFVSFITLLLLMSCNGDEAPKNKQNKQIFTYNQPNPVTSLDPAFARNMSNIWAVDHVFNGLVQLDENLNLKPSLAKSWSVSDDGLLITFNLRDDVYFQDNEAFPEGKGRKVTASDVEYSFKRIVDPSVSSPGAWIFKDRIEENGGFVALHDTLFLVKLTKPFRPMLGIFSMQYCSVVPKEAVDKYGKDFGRNPVGTGPYKFVKWQEGQGLILAKNEHYYEKGKPHFEAIRVNFMGDRNTAYLEFMQGNLDLMSGIESSFVNELLTKEGELQSKHAAQIDFYKVPFLNTEYIGINMNFEKGDKDNPLKHKKVRQALNYGIDRAKMLRSLRNNVGSPATAGFVPRGLPSFDAETVKGYDYNPDKARKLLAEAGFPEGKGLPPVKLYTNNDYKDICTYLTNQWDDLGVKVEIELMQSAVLREQVSNGTVPLFRASWIADYPDAESFLTMFYSKNPAPPNYTRFNHADYDKLYEKALNENDDQKRYDLYHQMDQILIEEAPVIFLFYDETARFSQKKVKGYVNNAINLLSVKGLKVN